MKTLLPLLAVMQALFLGACSSIPMVEELTRPLVETPVLDALLNPKKLSPTTQAVLKEQDLASTYRKDPAAAIKILHQRTQGGASHEHRIALIELCSDTGDRLAAQSAREASGYHLAAAELAYEGGLARSASSTHREELLGSYNHNCGQLARAMVDPQRPWSEVVRVEGPWRSYRLRWNTKGTGLLDPRFIDTLTPAAYLEFKRVKLERIREKGVGAAMVGHRIATPERVKANPLLAPVGLSLPINATLEFSSRKSEVGLSLHDLTLVDDAVLAGRSRHLSADRTAPLAILFNYATDHKAGWKGLVHPERYLDQMGLYEVEPFRPDQIPVILVHGLGSSPKTWLAGINQLRADPVLRKKYQVLYFRYPTGFPVAYNAAALRQRLKEYQQQVDPGRRNPRMRNMIIVGHSMGGILSDTQIRSSKDTFTKRMFTRPIDELGGLSDDQKRGLKELLIYEANPDITRAIFIAAPHRGSDLASTSLGSLGHKLIKFPIDVLTSTTRALQPVEGMTDLGREVVTNRPDSIWSLQPNSPGLTAILEQPVRRGVRYHSIIGHLKASDPLLESSDGLVPYWSSHLEGAASEKVVPYFHNMTAYPDVIAEVRRILYLHAGMPQAGASARR